MEDAKGLLELIDSIARERRWLLNTEAYWGVEGQRRWIGSVLSSGGTMLVAEGPDGRLVGWADVSRSLAILVHHVGTLGMGVRRDYRGVGLGSALLEAITEEARELGVERLELVVRAGNGAAIGLYERHGWRFEGRSPRAFKLDDEYEDRIQMGLWLGPEE